MNNPKLIVVHCSATKEGVDLDVNDIRDMHLKRGWRDVGYHYVITLDGKIQKGRKPFEVGAHVSGHNKNSVGICYIGGLDKDGKAKDTRTPQQKAALIKIISGLKLIFDIDNVVGHRDLSPDIDGDGVVESHEWLKMCPCFDAIKEYKEC